MPARGTASRLLQSARKAAGLSQAELGRRADVPRSVVNAYERGSRDPSTESLARLLAAAGSELRVERARVDVVRNARILEQVLDLAELLPTRRRGPLRFPPLHRLSP